MKHGEKLWVWMLAVVFIFLLACHRVLCDGNCIKDTVVQPDNLSNSIPLMLKTLPHILQIDPRLIVSFQIDYKN